MPVLQVLLPVFFCWGAPRLGSCGQLGGTRRRTGSLNVDRSRVWGVGSTSRGSETKSSWVLLRKHRLAHVYRSRRRRHLDSELKPAAWLAASRHLSAAPVDTPPTTRGSGLEPSVFERLRSNRDTMARAAQARRTGNVPTALSYRFARSRM